MKYIGITVVFLLTFLISSYLLYRIYLLIPRSKIGDSLFLLFALFVVFSFPISLFAEEKLPISVVKICYHIGSTWFIFMIYFMMLFIAIDLLRLANYFLKVIPTETFLHYTKENGYSFSLLIVIITGILSYGYYHYQRKVRVPISLTIYDQFGELTKPLRVVAFSDLHLGYIVQQSEFDQWIELINRERPDLVLIIGDMIDNSLRPLNAETLTKSIAKIESPLGIYTILGNHEYIKEHNKNQAFLKSIGVTLLQDESVLLGDYLLVGRDDKSNRERLALTDIIRPEFRSYPMIVMDHQPYSIQDSVTMKAKMHLSGHSHKGQIWPYSLVTKFIYELDHGSIVRDETLVIVSSGIGIWGGKFRIGTQSEYWVIDINADK